MYKFQNNAFTAQDFKTLFLGMVGLIRVYGDRKDEYARISPMEKCKYDTTRLMTEIGLIDCSESIFKSAVHVAESLRLIQEFLDTVTVAFGNIRLQFASVMCYRESVDREKRIFKERFDSGSVTLVRTTIWLETTIRFALENRLITKENDKLNVPYIDICKLGMVYIISSDPIYPEVFAETLSLDIQNLLDFQVIVDKVIHGYVLYLTLGEVIKNLDATKQACVRDSTARFFTTDPKMSVSEIGSNLLTLLRTLDLLDHNQLVSLGMSMSLNIVSTSPVFQICVKRIRQTLFELLNGTVPKMSTTFVVDRLKAIMERFTRIVNLNIEVYAVYYNDILSKLVMSA